MAGIEHQYDVLVIGSGAAGLTAALTLATKLKVLVLAKGKLTSGSTPGRRAALLPFLMQATRSRTIYATRWWQAQGSTIPTWSNS